MVCGCSLKNITTTSTDAQTTQHIISTWLILSPALHFDPNQLSHHFNPHVPFTSRVGAASGGARAAGSPSIRSVAGGQSVPAVAPGRPSELANQSTGRCNRVSTTQQHRQLSHPGSLARSRTQRYGGGGGKGGEGGRCGGGGDSCFAFGGGGGRQAGSGRRGRWTVGGGRWAARTVQSTGGVRWILQGRWRQRVATATLGTGRLAAGGGWQAAGGGGGRWAADGGVAGGRRRLRSVWSCMREGLASVRPADVKGVSGCVSVVNLASRPRPPASSAEITMGRGRRPREGREGSGERATGGEGREKVA